MEDWDEKKLEEVVNKKHSESDKAKPKTSIVCTSLQSLTSDNIYCKIKKYYIYILDFVIQFFQES